MFEINSIELAANKIISISCYLIKAFLQLDKYNYFQIPLMLKTDQTYLNC